MRVWAESLQKKFPLCKYLSFERQNRCRRVCNGSVLTVFDSIVYEVISWSYFPELKFGSKSPNSELHLEEIWVLSGSAESSWTFEKILTISNRSPKVVAMSHWRKVHWLVRWKRSALEDLCALFPSLFSWVGIFFQPCTKTVALKLELSSIWPRFWFLLLRRPW